MPRQKFNNLTMSQLPNFRSALPNADFSTDHRILMTIFFGPTQLHISLRKFISQTKNIFSTLVNSHQTFFSLKFFIIFNENIFETKQLNVKCNVVESHLFFKDFPIQRSFQKQAFRTPYNVTCLDLSVFRQTLTITAKMD